MASVKNINTDYTLNVGTPAGNGIFTVNAQTVFTGNVTYNVPSITTSPFLTVAANNTGALTDMGLLAQTNSNTFAGLRFDTLVNAWQTSNSVYSNGTPITAYANINTPPAGSNTEIQFNNNGVFDANANLTFNSSTSLLSLGGNLSASGNVISQNIITAGLVSATGNVTGNYILGNGSLLTGVVTSLSNINNGNSNVTISASAANVTVSVSGIGNVAVFSPTGEYVTGLISASGNITGGNVQTAGLISASGNITGGNVQTAGLISATGNVTGNFIFGNGSQLTGIITSVSNVVNGESNLNIETANANVTVSVSTVGNVAVFTPNGVSILGNVAASNTISATGNIYTAEYFVGNFSGNISGNITVPGANTDVLYNYNGNVGASSGFTFNQSTNVVTVGGNIALGGNVSAAGNVTGNYILGNGSQLTGVITSVDANSLLGNTLSSNVIFSSLTTVGALANLSVSGNTTLANITVVNTTLSSIGNLIAFAGNSGIVLPTGNSAQRPVSSPIGTTRFNTTVDSTETWNGTTWVSGGNVVTPGSITNQQFTGDGSNVTFPLDQSSTTTGVLVSINGVWQQPFDAYTVTGNSITFLAQPNTQDVVDVRFISYLTSVSYLTNDSGNSSVNVSPSGNIQFTTANNTFAIMTASSFDINYPVSAAGNVTIGGLLTSPQQTKAASDPGSIGQICWDTNYIYVCTATNTWKRTALIGGY